MNISTPIPALSVLVLFSSIACSNGSEKQATWKIEFGWQSEITDKKTKTIEDYFYLLPSEILDCENLSNGIPSKIERSKLIRKVDAKNGYLEFFNNSQIALFKDKSANIDFVAIQFGQSGAGNNCGSVNSAYVFDSKKKKWVERLDVFDAGYSHRELYNSLSEKDVLPYFYLPRKGVEIQIKDENTDSTIGTLKWNGKRFIGQMKKK